MIYLKGVYSLSAPECSLRSGMDPSSFNNINLTAGNTDMVFLFTGVPCPSYLTDWTYLRQNTSPTVYLSIWRRSPNNAVSLKHTTTAGPAPIGVYTVNTSIPVPMDPSDIISIHYDLGELIPAIGYANANTGMTTVQTETFRLYEANITSSTIIYLSTVIAQKRAVSGRAYPVGLTLNYQGMYLLSLRLHKTYIYIIKCI